MKILDTVMMAMKILMTDDAFIDSDDIDENYNGNNNEHDGGDDDDNDDSLPTKRSGTIKNLRCIFNFFKNFVTVKYQPV